jgi:hypothetical protein
MLKEMLAMYDGCAPVVEGQGLTEVELEVGLGRKKIHVDPTHLVVFAAADVQSEIPSAPKARGIRHRLQVQRLKLTLVFQKARRPTYPTRGHACLLLAPGENGFPTLL